jgi:LuxR family transcriptional regulator, quorum-sensing system regulator CviR
VCRGTAGFFQNVLKGITPAYARGDCRVVLDLHKAIDKNDAIQLLQFVARLVQAQDLDEFKDVVSTLRNIFIHENSFCSFADLRDLATSKAPAVEIVDINYPPGLLEYYFTVAYNRADPVITEFSTSLTIQRWSRAFAKHNASFPGWAIDGKLGDGYTHGVKDANSQTVSTFSFNGISNRHYERTEAILNYLIPHLAEALKKCLGVDAINAVKLKSLLTRKEIHVLEWLKQGKSSWEISMIFKISERTVNFHVNNIVKKLNAANRLHAVAIACNARILEI